MGASHLLLLQRDSHGVQLPGEGTEVVLKWYHPFLLNSYRSHRKAAGRFGAPFKRTSEEHMNVSLIYNRDALISLCCYYLNANIEPFPTATLTFHPCICLCAYLIQQIVSLVCIRVRKAISALHILSFTTAGVKTYLKQICIKKPVSLISEHSHLGGSVCTRSLALTCLQRSE